MSDLEQMYERERKKWDEISDNQLSSHNLKLREGDDFYQLASRDSEFFGVAEFLGNLEGKQVLEYGCGSGYVSVLLANTKAHVTSFDISQRSIEVTEYRAAVNKIENPLDLAVAAGEAIPFANNSFDIVFGKAILHHLKADLGTNEIYRVLKPGGKAVFIEPLGTNPLLRFIRDYVPYPNKNPVGDDRPLSYEEIKQWGSPYSSFRYQEIHLFGMIERALGFKYEINLKPLHQFDQVLVKSMPFLKRFSRYVVMYMVK